MTDPRLDVLERAEEMRLTPEDIAAITTPPTAASANSEAATASSCATPTGPSGAPRVSRMRRGSSAVKPDPAVSGVYQPARSASRSTVPPLLYSDTLPPAPRVAVTRFGTVWLRLGLRLLEPGSAWPVW